MLNQWLKTATLALALLCSGVSSSYADLRVFACEPEWAALAKALGGEYVTVYTATTNQQDPHHIQARPSLIAQARRADVLICTGAELEVGWLPLLLRKSGNPKIQAGQPGFFMATDHVALLEKPTALDRSEGDIHAAGNPHIQLGPERMLAVATHLSNTLIKLDPSNQSGYRETLMSFTQEWQNMMDTWRQKTQAIRGSAIVVHHKSWLYLQEWLGLKQVAVLEPKPGIPPTTAHLSRLLSHLERTPARLIIRASHQDKRAADWLSQKTGIPSVALDLSPAENETLTQWFDRLITQLLQALA